ncbi:hypothetical protein AAFF_G00312290 [Aldrovandia affinis]|uniref:PH domain-containing protein n=1 Tax=Aldrovandia affinis TaxID=143900 RepID=A0AAD7WQR2_9TELE|nr:hypothetical protein AAFF_G00312290 [Aldrovandia affinis]
MILFARHKHLAACTTLHSFDFQDYSAFPAPGPRLAQANVQLDDSIVEKMLLARDTTHSEAQRRHRKWLKHQVFMAQLAQNKEWLEKIEKEGQQLMLEKPELSSIVQQKLEEIRECWLDLESSTQAKAQQLFENSKAELGQSYTNLRQDGQLCQMDHTQDMATVNKQLNRLQPFKSPVEGWYKEMRDLDRQEPAIPQWALLSEDESEKQSVAETRMVRLIEPLKERRRMLLATKEVHQISRDLNDEIMWAQERLPVAMCTEYGNSLPAVQQLMTNNQGLQRELQEHQARVQDVVDRAVLIAAIQSPETDFVRDGLEQLRKLWDSLCLETERQKMMLDTIFQAQQYFSNVAEVKFWLSEQEHHLRIEDKGKDEPGTLELLKKHLVMEQAIEDYAERIDFLSQQCQQLLELGHPHSEQIHKQQSHVDRLYACLKDMVEERKSRLEQQYWLCQLNREVDDLEQWISEREVVASSHELGQDFEHVTILQGRFTEFSSETCTLGQKRVTALNKMADELIDCGHVDAVIIAEWKDGLNESWADLLEMMDTRGQMLAASHQLHTFFANCQEVCLHIEDKKRRLPEVKACQKGAANTSTLQRLVHNFEHDIQLLVTEVRQLQESANQLRTIYAGEKAEAIARKEKEIMLAWTELVTACEECRVQVTTVSDKLNFFAMANDLSLCMDSLLCQIGTGENPRGERDVSVEVMVNYHQSLRSNIEARNKSMLQCLELGKTLLAARTPAAEEVKDKLDMLMAKQKELSEKWDKQWEELQQMLEVHQFSQEAGVAEAWLTGKEPFTHRQKLSLEEMEEIRRQEQGVSMEEMEEIRRQELGGSVEEMEQLIRCHQAFRKAAATWEGHFSLLRRLSAGETVKAKHSKLPPTPLLGRKVFLDPQAPSAAPRTSPFLLQQPNYEQAEPRPRHQKLPTTSVVQRLGSTVANYTPVMNWSTVANYTPVMNWSTVANYTPVMNWSSYRSLDMQQSPTPDQLPSKIDTIHKSVQLLQEICQMESKKKEESVMANVVGQATGQNLSRDTRGSRSDPQMDHHRLERERRLGRQTSSEQEIKARWEELPLEVREHRYRRRIERQSSSEQEYQTLEGSKKSSEPESTKELSDKRSGGEKRSTMAEIVEQLQEREAAQAQAEAPRMSNGILDRVTRPDRPRARDRPKPRRRPRPKEPVETRRSRSAPAQSAPTTLQPPSHTAQHQGFLFRKHDMEIQKTNPNSRSWVNLYCVLAKGEIGFYKDAKNTSTPYNSEPLLNLSSCTCDVTNGYKKKKNVFGLKTTEGTEFYFHARDEEDLKGWITNITTSIAEHEEIAKWGKPQATTSSAEEGTKRDGDASDKTEKSDLGAKLEEKDTMERSDGCSSLSVKTK